MAEGEVLNLLAYGDIVIQRVLVAVENDVYFVCKPDEFERAQEQHREPVCIGFRREYVLAGSQ